jgi:hypothetical protein
MSKFLNSEISPCPDSGKFAIFRLQKWTNPSLRKIKMHPQTPERRQVVQKNLIDCND